MTQSQQKSYIIDHSNCLGPLHNGLRPPHYSVQDLLKHDWNAPKLENLQCESITVCQKVFSYYFLCETFSCTLTTLYACPGINLSDQVRIQQWILFSMTKPRQLPWAPRHATATTFHPEPQCAAMPSEFMNSLGNLSTCSKPFVTLLTVV